MIRIFSVIVLVSLLPIAAQADVITFEELSLAPQSFENGANLNGGFSSNGGFFNNNYDATFDSWSGWAYSNVVDTTTAGFRNQYAAFPGSGAEGSVNYAVAFSSDAYINLPTSGILKSLAMANTTYAALSMRDGDSFAKQFGGPTGNDPDFFKVTITGFDELDANGASVGSVEVFLADYRSADNSLDFILSGWQTIDLAGLVGSKSLGFAFDSSDIGPFGINTPTYFALDNLTFTAVPEPASWLVASLVAASLVARRRGKKPLARTRLD
jgi:hypothetical protein